MIAAHQRGVAVRVMLNPARRSGESENEEARELLTAAKARGNRIVTGLGMLSISAGSRPKRAALSRRNCR